MINLSAVSLNMSVSRVMLPLLAAMSGIPSAFPQQFWQKVYASSSNYEYPGGLAQNGASYITGGQWGTGSNDIFFLITDNFGALQTIRRYAGTSSDFVYSFRQTTDGYALIGNTFVGFDRIPYILRVDNSGTLQWCNRYARSSGATNDYGSDGLQTSDGGYIFISQTNNCAYMNMVKTTTTGSISWQRQFQIAPGNCWSTWSIMQTTDGGYITAGYTGLFGAGSTDLFLVKYDNAAPASITWAKAYGRTSAEGWPVYPLVRQTSDGGFVAVTLTNGFGSPNYTPPQYVDPDCFCPPSYTSADCIDPCLVPGCTCSPPPYPLKDIYVVKTDAAGNINNNATSWARTYRTTDNDYGYDIIQTTDGGFAVAGYTAVEGGGNTDMLVLKIAGDGSFQWGRKFGDSGGYEDGREIIQTSDGGYLAGGIKNWSGSSNVYLVKINASGNTGGCLQTDLTTGVASTVQVEVTNANTNAGSTATTVTVVPLGTFTQTTPSPAVTNTGHAFTYTASPAYSSGTLCAPLPVTLASFIGKQDNETHVIEWTTAAEQGLSGFRVEHSMDGNTFSDAGGVKASGTPGGFHSYRFVYAFPGPGMNYYRLKLSDMDGKLSWSDVISIHEIGTTPAIRINKADLQDDILTLDFYLLGAGNGPLISSVYNLLGQKMTAEAWGPLSDGHYSRAMHMNLPPGGIYYIKLDKGDFTTIKRIETTR